jgi:purine-nucleoside phosphorylase
MPGAIIASLAGLCKSLSAHSIACRGAARKIDVVVVHKADADLTQLARETLTAAEYSVQVGAAWTTCAPFRETQEAINAALRAGILAVEMEAAALYAFAKARGRSVLCFAHVTNELERIDGDFEKGVADGAEESLRTISLAAGRWRVTDRGRS